MSEYLSSFKGIRGDSGLKFDRVLRKSDGAVLWKRSTPYYAIQAGKLVECPNATAWCGGYAMSSGEISNGYGAYYGGSGHPDGSGESWGADTGVLDTKGCAYLSVAAFVKNEGDPMWTTLTIYGNGEVIHTEHPAATSGTTNRTIDVSAYQTVRVHIVTTESDDNNTWVNVGLREVRLHD